MSKNTDTTEQTIINGTLTVKNSTDPSNYGSGDIELEGTLKTDNISVNTISGNLNILSKSIFSNTSLLSNNTILNTTGSININGDCNLYNTSSKLLFNGSGSVPSLTTRSNGAKIVFFPNITSSTLDTSIGIDSSNNLWLTSQSKYDFYNGSNSLIATLNSGIVLPIISTPVAPSTGFVTIYADSSDTRIKSINSSGVITIFGGGSSASPLTTKGDLFTYDGATNTRLPVGTHGQIILSDSSTTTGLKWSNYLNGVCDNVCENYGTANTTINTTFTDIQTDQFRTVTNAAYLNKANNRETIINTPGIYFVCVKVCLTKTVGTNPTICTVKIVDDVNNTGTFVDVPGAIGYILCNSTGNGVSDTCTICYIKSYNANSKLKIVASKSEGTLTDTITQRIFGVNLSVVNFLVDGYLDATRYFSSYTTTSKALTSTFANLSPSTILTTMTPFVYSGTNLTLNQTGIYFIITTFNIDKTSGTDDSLANFQITQNGTAIGTIGNVFSLDANFGFGNVCIPVLVSATSGDIIRVQGRTVTGSNLSCVSVSLNAIFLNSTLGQTNTDFIYMTSTSNTLLNTSTTDLPFQTEIIKTGTSLVHSTTTNTNEITIAEDGYYYIFSNMTYSNSTTTISNAQILTLYNNTISYNMYEGSYSEGTVNISTGGANVKTITTHNMVYIPKGFKIKVQGLRISSGGTVTTVGNQCSFLLFKACSLTPISTLKPFGDYFIPFASNYTTQITSTSFIPKGLFPTGVIPTGMYRVDWQYKNVTQTANAIHEVQMLLYTPQGTASQILLSRPPAQAVITNTPIYSGFLYLSLLQGNYTLEFDFRVVSGTNVAIRELQMSIYRVI